MRYSQDIGNPNVTQTFFVSLISCWSLSSFGGNKHEMRMYSWKDTTDTRSAERQLHLNTITNSIPFVKITLTQLLLFANRDSFQEYSEQQRQFLASQRWRDSYMDHKTHVALKSFQPKILAVRGDYGDESCGGSLIPSFAKVRYFWLFTMLGLTVPYRRWFAKHCDVAEVTLTKEITV